MLQSNERTASIRGAWIVRAAQVHATHLCQRGGGMNEQIKENPH
jgi:hypothetical protein